MRLRSRVKRFIAGTAALVVALSMVGTGAASAASNPTNSVTYQDQTFFVYTAAGELPWYTFGRNSNSATTGYSVTVTDPGGTVQQTCTVPAGGPNVVSGFCEPQALTSVPGIWSIHVDVPATNAPYVRWTIEARTGGGTPIPGRVWVERDAVGQPGTAA
jgi:hypothetical protein